MRCVHPFTSRTGAFGCGQCLPCRVSKRRTWAHRILLEAIEHGENNCFVTLTYRDEKRSLDIDHVQRWLKRFRKRVSPVAIRYFVVGEYGDISQRPHYHAALFGWPPCGGGVRINGECQCHACSAVRETWSYGHVMVARLEMKSASYIAGYVTKKMTHCSDTRLNGRYPEFARMSLRPGIGAGAMHNVASDMMRYNLENTLRDVPIGLRYGPAVMPLGKYLRRRLRVLVGRDEKAPPEALQEVANQLQIVRAYAWQNDRSVSSVYEELFLPVEAQLQAKLKLKERKI